MHCQPSMCIVLALALAPAAGNAQQGAPLPPLTVQRAPAVNLLDDSGFEDADAGVWAFSDWPPRPESGARLIADSVRYTTDQAREGRRALVFDLTTVGADRILIAQQRIAREALAPHDGKAMRLSASVLLASGPAAQRVQMTMRQWGESGPPIDHHSMRMTADVNEWSSWSSEFIFRLGDTRKADVNITVGQSPDLTNSPVVFLDDVRLEVLGEPALAAHLACGSTLMTPDTTLPVEVSVSQAAWERGMRILRWNVTSPDGLRSHAEADMDLEDRAAVVNVTVPDLTEGLYALRLALGQEAGERKVEVLLPFRRAEGPFAR